MTDYIGRQAALDALGERPLVWTEDDYYSLGARNQYNGDRLAIETIPSADVEPVRHGRWINDRWEDDVNYHTCNACGVEIRVTYFDNYCPNCGARMDGDENADEITV